MTVKALKKNNMERKSTNGGFKMKGHTLPGIKQFKSTKMADGRAKSSSFQKRGDKAKLKSMQETHAAVTGDMTDQQLRDMAVAQHAGKSSKFNVDIDYLKKLRAARRTKTVEKPVETKKEAPTPSPEDRMQAFTVSSDDRRSIEQQYGSGVLTGSKLAARNKALQEAADRFASRRGF